MTDCTSLLVEPTAALAAAAIYLTPYATAGPDTPPDICPLELGDNRAKQTRLAEEVTALP